MVLCPTLPLRLFIKTDFDFGIYSYKARAVKDNWYASDIVEYTFFKGTYRPTLVELLNEPNPQYQGARGATRSLIRKKVKQAISKSRLAWLS
jgi:hypothetical protein